VLVVNKADLLAEAPAPPYCALSVHTGQGMADFIAILTAAAQSRLDSGSVIPFTRSRHREALRDTHAALERALAAPAIELMAEDLRLAAHALGRISGRVRVDDILDAVFSRFCIGK